MSKAEDIVDMLDKATEEEIDKAMEIIEKRKRKKGAKKE